MFRILIVEDDLETQRLFAHVLSKNGYRVDCARNGKEALSALDREYYDLLISDIMMPVMDGYELVQSLREANMTPPVLMITAKDGFDDMRQGFLAGADDYMVKPVNVNEILLRVQALLRRARVANERRDDSRLRFTHRQHGERELHSAAERVYAAVQNGLVPGQDLHTPAVDGRHLGL